MKYITVWKQLTTCAFASYASNRIDSVSFFIGKLIRFGFVWLLIVSLFQFTPSVAGYTKYEVLLFFVTFHLTDVLAQAFFRGIYLLKNDIHKGNFDYILSKPINPLFYSLSRLNDLLDFIFLIPILALTVYVMTQLEIVASVSAIFLYILFLFFSLITVLSIHIISAAITIWTMESENFIWFYRNSMFAGQFPPEIFSPGIQMVFTYIIPIIVIVAFPTKALLGTLSLGNAASGIAVAAFFFSFSLILWRLALRKYSSASS